MSVTEEAKEVATHSWNLAKEVCKLTTDVVTNRLWTAAKIIALGTEKNTETQEDSKEQVETA